MGILVIYWTETLCSRHDRSTRPSNRTGTRAVDRQDSSGDEPVAHQEDHRRGNFFRLADPPDRELGPARKDSGALRAEGTSERGIDQAGGVLT